MTKIAHLSDEELDRLEQKLAAHQKAVDRERRRRQVVTRHLVQLNVAAQVDHLLALCLGHDVPDCSDADPCNDYLRGCLRCTLLRVKAEEFFDQAYTLDWRCVLQYIPTDEAVPLGLVSATQALSWDEVIQALNNGYPVNFYTDGKE